MSEAHRKFMWEALNLARRGRLNVSPNPMVGCVIVKDGRVIGSGYHERFGQAHAEVNALNEAGPDARGATLYVTLEPCSHQGKTGPCTTRVIEAGIARVEVAMPDPNPLVNGQGINQLREAGISVNVGLLQAEARDLNRAFISHHERHRPWVTAKWAMTLDGKIATRSGNSRWITGEAARRMVHEERSARDGIMVGIGTVLADDPTLTARGQGLRNPKRFVIDPALAMPSFGTLANTVDQGAVVVYCSLTASDAKEAELRGKGIEVVRVEGDATKLVWEDVMADLHQREITSLLLEGGRGLLGSAFDARMVDEAMVFVAPRIVGGRQAFTPVGGEGVELVANGYVIEAVTTQVVGQDLCIGGRVSYHGNP